MHSPPGVNVGTEKLEVVTEFKYLGVILDSNFSFKKHIKMITKKIHIRGAM